MAFSGGNGTSTNPYQITTVAQLNDVRNYLTSYFILMNDLDLNVSPYNTGSGWPCIGTGSNKFRGNFNGDGYIIKNLFINVTTNYVGLFGWSNGANIRNVGLTDVNIKGNAYVGGLSGIADGSTLINKCFSTGTIDGGNSTGGLIGDFEGSGSSISNCFSNCSVGKSTGSSTGGLVGVVISATISDSYSTGKVIGSGSNVGGFIGYTNGTTTDCFWDTQTSGKSTSSGGTGKTTTEIKTPSTFSSWASGESDPWKLTAGSYPELRVFIKTPTATNINITSIIATSTNQAIVPTISISKDISITSILATTSNQAIVPTISTLTITNANINSLVATSTNQAKTPIITTTTIIDVNINSALATVTNQAINPIITAEIVLNASIMASMANCTSRSKIPLISAIINEIAQINISEAIMNQIIQSSTASHIINQLSRRIRTEVM